MSCKLSRSSYESLVAEDIAWLEAQPRTLEREHVVAIVRTSVEHEYDCPRLTRERDEARAEAEKYLQNIEQRQREFAGVVDELDRQRKEKRAWNIDANNLKTQCDLHLQHAKSAERDVTSLANKLDLADHKLAAAQAEVARLEANAKQSEYCVGERARLAAEVAELRRVLEQVLSDWLNDAPRGLNEDEISATLSAPTCAAPLLEALKMAHRILRDVNAGEPCEQDLGDAEDALKPWVKP